MKKTILDNADVTSNSAQVAVLKQNFPSCFDKDGRFLSEKLAEIVSAEGADISREGYSLNWLGKSYARLMANLQTETLLAANVEHNAKPANKNSENILIQGDNLDVLKHLKNAYAEKIKMIYIDPPYNTGSDGFVYQDDRKFTVSELSSLAGIDEDEAKRILDFTTSNSSSHSAWLTFMYPRLYVARELIHEDGVIFISIDNNEQAQLKLLCDEVFGEANFVGQFVHNKLNSKNDSASIQNNHDYVICYARQAAVGGETKEGAALRNVEVVTKQVSKEGDRHYFLNDPITTRGEGGTLNKRENLGYTVYYNPTTGEFDGISDYDEELAKVSNDEAEVYSDVTSLVEEGWVRIRPPKVRGQLGAWTWELDKFNKDKDQIVICETKNGFTVRKRTFVSSESISSKEGKSFTTFEAHKPSKSILEFSTNDGTNALTEIMGISGLFNNPKSIDLLMYLAKLVPSDDHLTLDFFAGSGALAHAIMQLNAQDKGTRKYATVQINENTSVDSLARKNGYNTIYEITRDRIVKAAKKIRKDNPDADCDFGFKEFRTVPVFDNYLQDSDSPEQYKIFDGDALTHEQRSQLLLTWQVYDGLPLTLDLLEVDLEGYTAHEGRHILYCINSGLTLDNMLTMLSRIDSDDDFAPTKIVIFESVLSSKAKREIVEAVNGYNNRKQLELNLEIRL